MDPEEGLKLKIDRGRGYLLLQDSLHFYRRINEIKKKKKKNIKI